MIKAENEAVTARRLRSWEWLAILTILLLGFALRVANFMDAPPGVIHDEVRNWLNVQLILNGDIRALYPFGGGREALYLFGQALSFRLIGDNLLAARLPSIAVGMFGIAISFSLARRLFKWPAGLVAAAGLATSFWAVLFARLAVRTSTMPYMALLTSYVYLRLLLKSKPRVWEYAVGGVLLGATLYTYPSALIYPGLLVGWLVVIWLVRREWLRGKLPGLAAGFVLAAVVAVPLVRGWSDPTTAARADEINAPLEALMAGDPGLVLANVGPVLGVFSVKGDHGIEFNIQDQPIFPTIPLAILFYLGVIWSVSGALQPKERLWPGYAFVLLWAIAMLVPTLVTENPVNPSRTIGLLGIVYFFPAVAVVWALAAADDAGQRMVKVVAMVIAVAALFVQLDHTVQGYFTEWNDNEVTRFLYQDNFRSIAGDMDALNGDPALALGGLTPQEVDPASMRLLMQNDERAGRAGYFDPQTALLLTSGAEAEQVYVYIAETIPLRPDLAALVANTDRYESESFARYTVDSTDIVSYERSLVVFGAGDASIAELLDVHVAEELTPGQPLVVITRWRTHAATEASLRIFMHLVDEAGTVITQSDVLGVPSTQWGSADVFLQYHELWLPEELPAGPYAFNIGLYNPADGQRLGVVGEHVDYVQVPVLE